MKDEQKSLMKRQYTEVLEMQKCIRSLVAVANLDLEVEPDPEFPDNVDQMMHALNTVRTNLNLMEMCLNNLDWETNGPELRPRSAIQADIDYDTFLLNRHDPTERRTREEIQKNVAYDQMQIKRL